MRRGRADGGFPSGDWFFPCRWWAGWCRGRLGGSSDSPNLSPPSTTGKAHPQTEHEMTTTVPLDRQVDAWLASLRAQGYSSRQLEYRAGVLGRWAGHQGPTSPAAANVVAAFLTWRDGGRRNEGESSRMS